ncbi:MAG: hypothetical protein IRZ21_11370 [Thermoleophilaceae bacterium]|nr:hypothetical protein [Thermoleophilaceae bacterium]
MARELRPTHEAVSCEVCGRTILKGERPEAYLAPGGQRKLVCDLCIGRAQHEGWIRESAQGDTLAAPSRREPRRGLMARLRRRREQNGQVAERAWAPPEGSDEPGHHDAPGDPISAPPPPRRKDARHVRAVPTDAQVKVERALEVFNAGEHVRTVAGIARTLGDPWVYAAPLQRAPSEVEIVVAWELSWYRYRVDLGDADDPVTLLEKGEDLSQLSDEHREWNAAMAPDGRLAVV